MFWKHWPIIYIYFKGLNFFSIEMDQQSYYLQNVSDSERTETNDKTK